MMVVGMALSPQDYSTWVPDICTTHYSAVPDVPRYVRPRLSIVFPKKKKNGEEGSAGSVTWSC